MHIFLQFHSMFDEKTDIKWLIYKLQCLSFSLPLVCLPLSYSNLSIQTCTAIIHFYYCIHGRYKYPNITHWNFKM